MHKIALIIIVVDIVLAIAWDVLAALCGVPHTASWCESVPRNKPQ
jgi:hypothetical protein